MKTVLVMLLTAGITVCCSAQTTIFVAGDSTAANYSKARAPMTGWAQVLNHYTEKGVRVENRAAGGRSTKSFRDEKRWDRILNDLKPGDYVMIQFGHNDQKKDKPAVYAAAETDYRNNLKRFIAEVRAKKANPVLLTSVARRVFNKQGKLWQSLGKYPQVTREVAKETGTPLIDANKLTMDWLTKAGPDASIAFFTHVKPGEFSGYPKGSKDNTHFRDKGAEAVAKMIVEDAKRQKLEISKCFK